MPQVGGDFGSYHLFLEAQPGSWSLSPYHNWFKGIEQQALKSHSPQEHLSPLPTWLTNVFPPEVLVAAPHDADSIPVVTSSRMGPRAQVLRTQAQLLYSAAVLWCLFSRPWLLPDPQSLHLYSGDSNTDQIRKHSKSFPRDFIVKSVLCDGAHLSEGPGTPLSSDLLLSQPRPNTMTTFAFSVCQPHATSSLLPLWSATVGTSLPPGTLPFPDN